MIGDFSIKLVHHLHPQWPHFGQAGNPTLMNFPGSPEGSRVANATRNGHRSLVYLMSPTKRFGAAIRYVKWNDDIADVLEDGRQAAEAQGAIAIQKELDKKYAKLWRCVRIVAWINDPMKAPTPDFGFGEGTVIREITRDEYLEMFNEVPWDWKDQADFDAV